ncbi:MAG: hypothetical protein LBK73_13140 [Treponema sp.]|jgi:hypothetical protein|nr:hypothetical protein [Treponema sp.]
MAKKTFFWGTLAMALAFGLVLAGCESTPSAAYSNFIVLNGEIVEAKPGIDPFNGAVVTFYGVDLDGNKDTVEKHIFAYPKFQANNPDLQIGADVVFKESDYNRASGIIGDSHIIAINQKQVQY